MKIRDYKQFSDSLLCLACIWSIISITKSEDIFDSSPDIKNKTSHQKDETAQGVKDSRGLFSPRMDYEQWKPLGRGDPLKNDPTYDYVPPVLDRVHYWVDSASRTPDSDTKKTEILVLGVSSKKPSTGFSTVADNRRDTFDSYDPFLKFVESPNFNVQNYQRRPQYTSQNYYSTTFYKNSKGEQKEPYTMLVPPPMPTHEQSYQQPIMSSTSTTTPITLTMTSTTPSSVAIEEANLVYQASSLSTTDEWKGSNTYATIAESSSQVTWRTPPETNNKTAQQLPTLKAPENFKDTYSIIPSMNVVLNPMSKLQNVQNMETDIIVAPSEMAMHKGQVTDDTLDLSSTYVSIGKPDASIQPATGMGMDAIPMKGIMKQNNMLINSPLISSVINPMISPSFRKHPSPLKKLEMIPMTLQSMQTMQTMQPPPPTHMMLKKPLPLLHNLLKKESISQITTIAPPTTTSVSSLTTDPLFKHYKQPNEPMRGPMYLIIQGHSKVKTYGPSKQINGISVQETNEIPTFDDRQTEYPVKHLHELMKENDWDREKRDNRQGRLQTLSHLLVSGLGALDFADPVRRRDDVKETELIVKYDVSSGEDVTSEVYHKGIVESEIPPNRPLLTLA